LADNFTIYVDLPEEKSVYETQEVTSCILRHLKDEEIITDMSVFLGEGAPVDFSAMIKGRVFDTGENIANILVNFKREDDRDESSLQAVHRLRPLIQNGCTMHDVNIKMVELPAGPPTLASLVLEITSDDKEESMEALAYTIEGMFKKTDGLVDIDVVNESSYMQYRIVLEKNKITASHLQLDQVKKIMYLAFEGMDIAFVNDAEAENQIPIHVTTNKENKTFQSGSYEHIMIKFAEITFMNSLGSLVPLSELVMIKEERNGHKIISKNLTPIISVVAETDMESQIYPLLSIRDEIIENLAQKYDVEKTNMLDLALTDKKTGEHFKLHWGGELKLSMDTIFDLGTALGAAIIIIFFMMVVYYKSFSIAGAVVLASFISVGGVIYIHLIWNLFTSEIFYMTGTSLIGFIALIGINSRNSLLIEEKHLNVEKAISVSVYTRAKPILLTALATILASSLLATDPVFGGLGVALIGGTIASYLVSLFIIPIIIHGSFLKKYGKGKINDSN
jgi:multidrug efflux pump subunit AcrB